MSKLLQKFNEVRAKSKTKRFTLFRGSDHQQELDLETTRNIIVNKISKILAQKLNRPVEEVEDNIRLREIEQGGVGGNYFSFKYSVYNRPLLPWNTTLNTEDLHNYMRPDFDVKLHPEDDEEEDIDDTEKDEENDVSDDELEDVPSDEEGDGEDIEIDDQGNIIVPPDLYDDEQLPESVMMKSFNKFRKSNIRTLNEGPIDWAKQNLTQGTNLSLQIHSKKKEINKLQEKKKKLSDWYRWFDQNKNKLDLAKFQNYYREYLKRTGEGDDTHIANVHTYNVQQIMDLIKSHIDNKDAEITPKMQELSKMQNDLTNIRGPFLDPQKSPVLGAWRDWRRSKSMKPPVDKGKIPNKGKGSSMSFSDYVPPSVKQIGSELKNVAKASTGTLPWELAGMFGKGVKRLFGGKPQPFRKSK